MSMFQNVSQKKHMMFTWMQIMLYIYIYNIYIHIHVTYIYICNNVCGVCIQMEKKTLFTHITGLKNDKCVRFSSSIPQVFIIIIINRQLFYT